MPTKTVLITQVGTSTFTVPADFGSLVSIEAIGGGGGPVDYNKSPGAGGGAYAFSNYNTYLVPGLALRAVVGEGGGFNSNGGPSSLTYDSQAFEYVYADYGRINPVLNPTTGGLGGTAANCRGSGPFYSGGNGGNATQLRAKGGGGGAGGFGGAGGNGATGLGTGGTSQIGGGGGGAGTISSGSSGYTGVGGLRGGNGGEDGSLNSGGLGAVNNSSVATTPSVGGGGGGGGGYGQDIYAFAAKGGTFAYWTGVNGIIAGPGGGGGGGDVSGRGGTYGGGAGGGFEAQGYAVGGGQGIIAFTYNVAATASSTPYSVGQGGVANYVNTTSSAVTKVVADNGLGSYSPVVVGSGGGSASPTLTISANQANVQVDVVALAGYRTGISNITITVNAGVNLYSTSLTTPALLIYGANTGDTVTLVNNGNIIGYGGNGGFLGSPGSGLSQTFPAVSGGPALSTLSNVTVVNNGNIGGGGGGGGGGFLVFNGPSFGGGGGAGGGTGNPYFNTRTISFTNPGPNGRITGLDSCCSCQSYYGGGDGGYIIATPTGGALGTLTPGFNALGIGGNAGGSGAASERSSASSYTPGNNGGGTSNAPTPTTQTNTRTGGGGGGFGGSGASGYNSNAVVQVGQVGGYAIVKNGRTVTVSGSGNVYGTQQP